MDVNQEGWVVISTPGCSSCELVKQVLVDNTIPYQSVNFGELTRYQKDTYIGLSKAEGCMGLPIILHNERAITMPKLIRMLKEGK